MRAEERVRRVDVGVGVRDPRQAKKVEHDRVNLRVCHIPSDHPDFDERVRGLK